MSEKPGKNRNLKEGVVRLNVNVPKSFYKEVKRWALENDMTITKMVIEALKRYMAEGGERELDRLEEWRRFGQRIDGVDGRPFPPQE